MLSNLLIQLDQILDSAVVCSSQQKKALRSFLKVYGPGKWIYPGVLKRNCGITIGQSYQILGALEQVGAVKRCYECHCGWCGRRVSILPTFNELPEKIECEECGNESETMANTIISFRVV